MPRFANNPADTAERENRLAQLVAEGMTISEAGLGYLGLTRGQTSRAWMNIKAGLGWQAQ